MRIVLQVEYDGTSYFGWQKQLTVPSIQATLEVALSKVANHKVETVCAGRTDAGVHALGQVVHFDSEAHRDLKAWILGTNANLPPDIRVKSAKEVPVNFHARFSAVARTYQYKIYNSPIPSAVWRNLTSFYPYKLNIALMQEAANYLLGEHDFSSFRGSGCQSRSTMRNVHFININRDKEIVILEIKANAFLLHMVRNIVGVLLEVGNERQKPIWAKEVLEICDRKKAAVTAPPQGLYLMAVRYSDNWQE